MLEPQFHVQILTGEGTTASVLSGFLQVGYLATPANSGSGFLAVHGGGLVVGNGSSNTIGALGFGGGYRWKIGPGGVLRLEARYRRWFDEDSPLNELAFALGIGGRFR